MFLKEKGSIIQEENPTADLSEKLLIASKMWRELTPEQKDEYEDLALNDYYMRNQLPPFNFQESILPDHFDNNNNYNYNCELPPDKLDDNQDNQEIMHINISSKIGKGYFSPFFCFSVTQLPSINRLYPNLDYIEKHRIILHKWETMSEAEKSHYSYHNMKKKQVEN